MTGVNEPRPAVKVIVAVIAVVGPILAVAALGYVVIHFLLKVW